MKINYRIQFVLFVLCLFFIGLGIFELSKKEIKTGMDLFWQISPFVPFVTSAIVFGYNLYLERIKKIKD
jgi:hypothetical protein